MNFDRVAPIYRVLERLVFGSALQQARLRWLSAIGQPQRALIIGEGDGRFLCELFHRHPQLRVECIDASARMLELAHRRLERSMPEAVARVTFRHGDVRRSDLSVEGFDLIVTHFVLDCFDESELLGVVQTLADAATPDATWLLADFQIPASGWARWYARMLVPTMYLFFRVLAGLKTSRLVDPSVFLHRGGFLLKEEQLTLRGVVTSQLWRRRGTSG